MAWAKVDESGRVQLWSHDEIEGFTVEFDNPDGLYGDGSVDVTDYVIRDGHAVLEPTDEHQEQLADMDLIPQAIADLSETASGNAEGVEALSDALADLSALVSELMSKEG